MIYLPEATSAPEPTPLPRWRIFLFR
ncbi:mgtA regulatory leader peptide MgtL [Salmonella enterica subsp. enterica serovar Infantis]